MFYTIHPTFMDKAFLCLSLILMQDSSIKSKIMRPYDKDQDHIESCELELYTCCVLKLKYCDNQNMS